MPSVVVPLSLFLSLLLMSCSGEGVCGQAQVQAAMSCASGIQYDGHFYDEWSTKLPAVRGDRLGSAMYPVCNATNDCATDLSPGGPTTVWELRGVDPQVAVVARTEGLGKLAVFARGDAEPTELFRQTRDGAWHPRRP